MAAFEPGVVCCETWHKSGRPLRDFAMVSALLCFEMARSLSFYALAFSLLLATPSRGAEPRARFSDEAIELFKAVSGGYLRGNSGVAPNLNPETVLRLTNSSDPGVRELAVAFRDHLYLRTLYDDKQKDLRRLIESRVPEMQAILAKGVLQSLVTNGNEPTLRGLAQDLDGIAQAGQQSQASRLRTLYGARALHNAFMAKVRHFADSAGSGDALPAAGLNATFITAADPKKIGLVVLSNRTDKPLHHCLVLMEMTMDTKATAAGQIEDAIGIPLMGLLGFSAETVQSTAEASAWRMAVANQPRASLYYVPEIGPKESILIPPCDNPRTLRVAVRVEAACWADEQKLASQELGNLAQVHATMNKMSANASQKSRAAQQSSAAQRAAAARKRASMPAPRQ